MNFQLGFKVHLQLRTTSKAEVISQSLFKEGTGFVKFLKPLLTKFFNVQNKYLSVFEIAQEDGFKQN